MNKNENLLNIIIILTAVVLFGLFAIRTIEKTTIKAFPRTPPNRVCPGSPYNQFDEEVRVILL